MGVFKLLHYAYANMGWAPRILSNKASEKDLHQGKWVGGLETENAEKSFTLNNLLII